MKIRSPSPHVLELTDSGNLLLWVGAFGFGFGFLAIFLAVAQHLVGAGLIGAVLGVAGAVCSLSSRARAF